MVEVSGAVEGPVDEALLRRLVTDAGGTVGKVYGRQGKDHLIRQVSAYNHAARMSPWIILMDLDREVQCVPRYIREILPNPAPTLCFRLAVRAMEAWLLADRERFAAFFSVSEAVIPLRPDELADPKQTLVTVARRSRRREIREELVPRAESGRIVGPGYTSWIIRYIQDMEEGWRPDAAARLSNSLSRAQACIRRLVG